MPGPAGAVAAAMAAAWLDSGFGLPYAGRCFYSRSSGGDGQVRLYHGVAFAAGGGGIFCNVAALR